MAVWSESGELVQQRLLGSLVLGHGDLDVSNIVDVVSRDCSESVVVQVPTHGGGEGECQES